MSDPLSPLLFNLALQNVIRSIKMVPRNIEIGKDKLNVLAYADDIVLIGKNEVEIRQRFIEIENFTRKLVRNLNQEKIQNIR